MIPAMNTIIIEAVDSISRDGLDITVYDAGSGCELFYWHAYSYCIIIGFAR